MKNQTDDKILKQLFTLRQLLATLDTVGIIIGITFSILCLFNYFKRPDLRTHYTYIFYSMLIYCLISATIGSPMFLIDHYFHLFHYSTALCVISSINYLAANIGMMTSLAYASAERHFLLFHKNGLLTWSRQLLPIVCILIYSYIVAILFTFIPTCVHFRCMTCDSTSLLYMIPWVLISFLLPEVLMIGATVCLLIRLSQQRTMSNRRLERSALKKIITQMGISIAWSCLYYCPVAVYDVGIIIDPSHFSLNISTAMDLVSQFVLQLYPIITYISMFLDTRRRLVQRKRQSTFKLHNMSTITTPQLDA